MCEKDERARFESAGQGHVFQYYDKLSPSDQAELLNQLKSIKVEKIDELVENGTRQQQSSDGNEDAQAINPFSGEVGFSSDKELVEKSRKVGLGAIAENKVAAVVLAGGQGTRLGFDGPKGMYDIGLPSKSSLFQMIAERILKLTKLASSSSSTSKVSIPWYIMTSPMNNDATQRFFQENSYFGLDPSDVSFFPQGVLPCLSQDGGKILMETPSKCAMSPDGNGGVYQAMENCGVLQNMQDRGVNYVHVFSIDNALVKPADPPFIGYCISQAADCGNKVVWKTSPDEKVGVMAETNGRPCVVEYSDMTPEMSRKLDPEGRLLFGAGNICNHFYTLPFIRDVIIPNMTQMYHIARKKIPVWDSESNATKIPTQNNGIKLETFIFDVFPLAKKMAIWDVKREEDFAPVKNAPGSPSDSPDMARCMLSNLAKQWVLDAGGSLVGDTAQNEDTICEVSPLTSYAGEGLDEVLVKTGREITCPFQI